MKWGVLGAGFFVNRRMAAEIAGDPEERIVAVQNRRMARAGEIATRLSAGEESCHAHQEFEALCSDPLVDAVYIATPNHQHLSAVQAAVSAGKPILCEKPLAGTLADGMKIQRLVVDSGIPFIAGFVMRHQPVMQRLHEMVREDFLGRISHGRFQACKTHPVTERSWRHWPNPKYGGGVIYDLGSHAVDLFTWLLRDRVVSVRCEARDDLMDGSATDQTALITLTYECGPLVSIELSFATPPAPNPVELYGRDGALVVETAPPGSDWTIRRIGHDGESRERLPYGGGFLSQARCATRILRGGLAPDPGVDVGLLNLRILEAAHRSWRTAETVSIESA